MRPTHPVSTITSPIRILALVSLVLPASATSWAQTEPAPQPQGGGKPAAAAPAPSVKLTIDLAAGTNQFWTIEAGTYTIELTNAIPGASYSIVVGATALSSLPPLQTSGSKIAQFAIPALKIDKCGNATTAAKNLVAADAESEVPDLRQKLQVELLACSDDPPRQQLIEIMNATTVDFAAPSLQIPEESRKTITIVRGGASSAVSASGGPHPRAELMATTWSVEYSTLSRGQWQTTFGWTFAPNHDEEYFSESDGNGKFVVKPRPNPSKSLTSLPSVFWTFLPSSQAFGRIQHGPTVGLGVTVGESGTRASVFGGYMLRFFQNIGIVGGIAIYPHRRLDTKYTEGQVIDETLDSDQLNRSAIRANVFFGAVLRFGSDPRKVPEGGDTAPAGNAGTKQPAKQQ